MTGKMNWTKRAGLALCVMVAAAATAFVPTASATMLDTFDDISSKDNWEGSVTITDGQLDPTSSQSFAIYTGEGGSNSDTVTADLFLNTGIYAALVLRSADINNNLFVKAQDAGGEAGFNRLYLYYGNNGSSIARCNFYDLSSDVTSLRLSVNLTGDQLTASVDFDFNGTVDDSVTWTIPAATLSNLGTDIGVGFYGETRIDNFSTDGTGTSGGGDPVPEPATLSLLGLGLAGLATRRLRRKA